MGLAFPLRLCAFALILELNSTLDWSDARIQRKGAKAQRRKDSTQDRRSSTKRCFLERSEFVAPHVPRFAAAGPCV